MILWIYFVGLTALMYLGTTVMGKLTGASSDTLMQSITNLLQPAAIVTIIFINIFFAASLYYGFIVTSNAIPISIAVGIVTTYVASIFLLGTEVTVLHILGLVLIVGGIYLLR